MTTDTKPLDLDALMFDLRAATGEIAEADWALSNGPALVAEVRRLRAEGGELRVGIFNLTRELEAMRSIIEGRTAPPTLAEVRAHEARGGDWLYQPATGFDDLGAGTVTPEAWWIVVTDDVAFFARVDGKPRTFAELPTEGRWWCWSNGPCAWPVVTTTASQPAG